MKQSVLVFIFMLIIGVNVYAQLGTPNIEEVYGSSVGFP